MSYRSSAPLVAGLLFCSGLCALIYQTVWLREFRLIFGASHAASAAVLGIFMGGLGLGSALLGRLSERSKRPLCLYGDLEFLIAVAAALTPFLVTGVRHLYAMTGGSMVIGHTGATVVRLLLATLVLIVPTVLMGGTLPAAARAVASQSDVSRRSLALLYGCNTLGAVTGAVISTFVLIEYFGNRDTLWLAAGANVLIAILARMIGRSWGPIDQPEPVEDKTVVAQAAAPLRFVLTAAAAAGFAFMLMELVWYRMLAPLLGGSTFTFGLILAVALFGIGIGGTAYAFFGSRRQPTLAGFALTCAIEAFLIALPYALGDRVAELAGLLRPLGSFGFSGYILAWTIVTALVVLPASVVAGYQFPMLIALLGKGSSDVGRHTGLAYAANTAGAIAGSLLGGFGLLPLLTAPGVWIAVVAVLTLLAVAAALWSFRAHLPVSAPALAMAGLACVLLLADGPTAAWRHSGIGAGRAQLADLDRNALEDWNRRVRRSIVWEADGRESSVGISASNGYSFVINGKVDGHIRGDAGTQVMSGLVAPILRPDLQKGMVIGLGTGSTAGWMAAIPEMKQVDVVELEPATVEIARLCAPANLNVLENPKVRIHMADAREVLLTTPERYDIIFSEPSNPYRAGIASLFTKEFYESASERLTPNGVFAQWVQAYEIDGHAIRTVYATLGAVFPHIQTWQTLGGDLLLLGSHAPITLNADQIRARIATEPFRSALLETWGVNTIEGFFAHFVADNRLAQAVIEGGNAEIATDDRNNLEFGFARNVGQRAAERMTIQLRRTAATLGCAIPKVEGQIDWDEVQNQTAVADLGIPKPNAVSSDSPAIAKRPLLFAYLEGNYERVRQLWKEKPFEPDNIFELRALSESLAQTGDPEAWRFLAQLAALRPSDADALTAAIFAHDKAWADAAKHLQKAFVAWRKDPWPQSKLVSRALDLAEKIAESSGQVAIARDLFTTLQEPFSVEFARESRVNSLLTIARFTEPQQVNDRARQIIDLYGDLLPWQKRFLELRVGVYKELKDPRALDAAEDVLRYRQGETERFDRGLRAPSPVLARQP